MDIDDLLAREGIRDLVARYNSYGDSGRFEPLFALFADDAGMEIGNAGEVPTVYDGLESVKQIFTGARGRVQEQLATGDRTYLRHFTATHQIDLLDADSAIGRCYFAVIMQHGLDHWGRYIDRYVRIEGTWKFQHRRVHVDGRSDQSWFAP